MHHAYYIEEASSDPSLYIDELKEEFGLAAHTPDLYHARFEKFGIEEARALAGRAGLKLLGTRGLFVVGVSSITSEAQQALLKLFEEPQSGVVFVLIVPHGTLLPTLRSRMLAYERKTEHDSLKKAKEFLSSSGKERSDIIAELLEEEEWERDYVRSFLHSLEQVLEKQIAKKEVRAGLEDIDKVRSYVNDRSPSLKMLLEHLALALPTI